MRRAALGLVLIAGCGGTDHPELHFDIEVMPTYVHVFATEVDRPDATNQQPFAHPGECDEVSDGWSCDGECPGTWLGALTLERDGEVLAEGIYDWPWGGGVGQVDTDVAGAVLVIEDLDGAQVEIPIPDVARPTPAIDDLTRTNIALTEDELAITWHTTPAAVSTVIEANSGYGGPRCHVARDADVTTMQIGVGGSAWSALVTGFAAPVTVETAFGDAEVWVGDQAYQEF